MFIAHLHQHLRTVQLGMNLNVVVHACDVPHSGCPIETVTPEIIDKVHDILIER